MDNPLKGLSMQIATTILTGFDRHFTIFSDITQGARERFENADWEAERKASRERILYYDIRVRDSIADLQKLFSQIFTGFSIPDLGSIKKNVVIRKFPGEISQR